MKELMKKYSHGLWFLYIPVYLWVFNFVETHRFRNMHILYSSLDSKIPFVEYFIVPYYLWFLFIAAATMYLFFTDKEQFKSLMAIMCSGMTIFLLVSVIYPNGLNLRPEIFTRDNIFIDMVKKLYEIDTPTNVLPSIHVFNTLCVQGVLGRNEMVKKHPVIKNACLVLSVSIILATMFLKQHSVIDVSAACLMYLVLRMVQVEIEIPAGSICEADRAFKNSKNA